jgi:glyoxylase-like metal-dependent hydrolase (beta-lactamase superfamily II)
VSQLPHDIATLRIVLVNVCFVGEPGGPWILVDTGLPLSAHRILRAAEERFGKGNKPRGIVLTHGHFDHVGAVRELSEFWDVPVWAHELELPYLTGRSSYPPPDPIVGGGLMSLLAPLYPRGPIDLGDRVRALPMDTSEVPDMPEWKWVHTPGHTSGHVSLFRGSDGALIAGDAFVTTKQESLLSIVQQRKEIHGPPMYYTSDWDAARASVLHLLNLGPRFAFTGHGQPMWGDELERGLTRLATHFDELAVPRHGRYVHHPAITDAAGVIELPASPLPKVAAAVAIGAAALTLLALARRRRTD